MSSRDQRRSSADTRVADVYARTADELGGLVCIAEGAVVLSANVLALPQAVDNTCVEARRIGWHWHRKVFLLRDLFAQDFAAKPNAFVADRRAPLRGFFD